MPSWKAMDSIKTPTDGPSIPSNALVPYTVVFSLTLHMAEHVNHLKLYIIRRSTIIIARTRPLDLRWTTFIHWMSQHDYNSYYTTAYKPRVIGITPLQYEPPNTDSVRPGSSIQFKAIHLYTMIKDGSNFCFNMAVSSWMNSTPHSQLPLQRRRRMQPRINFFVLNEFGL